MRRPRPTIRLRLTAWYAGIFLLLGAGLLLVSYAVVRENFDRAQDERSVEIESKLRSREVRVRIQPGLPDDDAVARLNLNRREREVYQQARERLQAADARANADAKRRVLLMFLAALVAAALLSVLLGYYVAGRVLRPVAKITAAARRISERTLDARIAMDGPRDELRELADTFDGMLERLDRAFVAQRRFAADASHELRTPLAIVRTEIDVTLGAPDASVGELREMGEVVREANERMERLIDALLTLAASGATDVERMPLDLAEVARGALDHEPLAGAGLRLERSLEPVGVLGERTLLERVVANLVDNAARYNEPGGFVHVATRPRPGGEQAEIVVANSGPDVAAEELDVIFEPFRRLDASRARATGGFGLGLAVVDAIARAHGGRVEAEPREGGGLEIRVLLPAAAVVADHLATVRRPKSVT